MDPLQGTEEWFKERLGKLTASNMGAALAVKKDGSDYAERENLKMRIIAERLTQEITFGYVNDAMKWGIECEPACKKLLTSLGYEIQNLGFINHPKIENFGASPDGIIYNYLAYKKHTMVTDEIYDKKFILEIKCPTTPTHLKWLLSGEIPEEHKPQMLAQMACTGIYKAIFVSYDPRIKLKHLQLFIREFTPAEKEIIDITYKAKNFLNEVEEIMDLIKISKGV